MEKDKKSLVNRIKSIHYDHTFVSYCSAHLKLPLIANRRAGCFYTDSTTHVYFKSTDGHYDVWDFNLKRMNLHALSEMKYGSIIVDATTKGKKFPDSLSKTIPIWCCVLNRALNEYRDQSDIAWDTNLYTLRSCVSLSEHSQIESKIPQFVKKLHKSSVNLSKYSKLLHKPLRPVWIHPGSKMFMNHNPNEPFWDLDDLDFIPVVCLSASSDSPENIFPVPTSFEYIQGAAV